MRKSRFAPNSKIALPNKVTPIAHKGRFPLLTYSSVFASIYSTTRSLSLSEAYARIRGHFSKCKVILKRHGFQGNTIYLPRECRPTVVWCTLSPLFPSWRRRTPTDRKVRDSRPTWGSAFPFRIASSNANVQNATLGWIDTNVKLNLERFLFSEPNLSDAAEPLAELILRCIAVVLKMDDYALARVAGPNHCMYLQDALLFALLGPEAEWVIRHRLLLDGVTANERALNVLARSKALTTLEICELSVAAGSWWPLNEGATTEPLCIEAWIRDDRERFIELAQSDACQSLAMICDDNGEVVFDLMLLQRLMQRNPSLQVFLIANCYPVDNNICISELRRLLGHDAFKPLECYRSSGRLQLRVEAQPFRAFLVGSLNTVNRRILERVEIVLIKGAAFAESFQPKLRRVHAFRVVGPMARQRVAEKEADGVFAFCSKRQLLSAVLNPRLRSKHDRSSNR